MEALDNTGLGLIGATIERVKNKKSLFGSALKKLVNSTEKELDDFLKRKLEKKEAEVKTGILRLISGNEVIKIKALDGRDLIYKAGKVFKSFLDGDFRNWGLTKKGIATIEAPVQVHEMVGNGRFLEILQSLPGTWNQKWLSQSQVIEFCKTHARWLRQGGNATFFLIKKDENKPIDENHPEDNLVVVHVRVLFDGLHVYVNRLEVGHVWIGGSRRRVVSPQLMPSGN